MKQRLTVAFFAREDHRNNYGHIKTQDVYVDSIDRVFQLDRRYNGIDSV